MVNMKIVDGSFDISDMIGIMLRRDVQFTSGDYTRLLVKINSVLSDHTNGITIKVAPTIKTVKKCTHHRKTINK
jgi:hypothetical protein